MFEFVPVDSVYLEFSLYIWIYGVFMFGLHEWWKQEVNPAAFFQMTEQVEEIIESITAQILQMENSAVAFETVLRRIVSKVNRYT